MRHRNSCSELLRRPTRPHDLPIPAPLHLHADYQLAEIMAAMGVVDPKSTKLACPQAGVVWHERYPDDRLDNLVVAHPECNRQKKDSLASAGHLTRWAGRLATFDTELNQIATSASWPRDTARSLGVIRGTYLKLPDGVALWRRAREFTQSRHSDLLEALAVAL